MKKINIEAAYNEHANMVYRFLLSLSNDEDLSRELTQETFLRALKSSSNYNGKCKLSVWLCQIAKHLWYQHLEKKSKYNQVELSDDIQDSFSTEDSSITNHDNAELFKAIHSLPNELMREVVYIRLSSDMPFKDIGEVFGKTENWARVTFYRAKQQIIKELEKNEM